MMAKADSPLASGLAAKVAVVEDEILIADSICTMLRSLEYTVPEPCFDYNGAIAMLHSEQPDLVLLDINLAGSSKDGIEVARYIRANLHMPFIFLTANSDPATIKRAKEVTPNSFLVKPFLQDDIYSSIEIAMHNFYSVDHIGQAPGRTGHLFIKEGGVLHKVLQEDIIYLSSNHVYVGVFTAKRKFLVRTSLQQYLDELDQELFVRIHRSYVVNRHKIEKINISHVQVGGTEFPVSKKYRDALLSRL